MRPILLATALAASYALLRGWPAGAHPLLRSCLAVLALVLGIGLWRTQDRTTGSHTTALRSARWPDYLAMGMGVLAVECLFLFFLTVTPPRAETLALTLEETLRPEAAARRAARIDLAKRSGPNSGNWLWDSHGRRPLPNSTNARPTNKPEVFYRASDQATADALRQGRPYLTAFALERYDHATWSPEPIPPRSLTPNPAGKITFPQAPNRPGPLLRGEIFHSAHPNGQDVLTTLQGPTEVTLSGLRRISLGIVRLLPLAKPSSGYNYPSAARPLNFDQLFALHLSDRIRPGTSQAPSLLALPTDPTLRDSILQIAVRTQGPLETRLLGLRKFLRENCTYSLDIANKDQLDPIENFLFHERRGHCEFFATSGALLCRALGIPSRVAYGWTGGRFFPSQNLFMFRAREAHAWTEIYLEEFGWVIFDCTPPGALLAATASTAPPGEKPPLDENGHLLNDEVSHPADLPFWHWAALAIGLGLLPLVALLLRLRNHPPADAQTASALILPNPPGYLTRFKQACHHQGHPMPSGRTLRQQLTHLAQQDLAPDFSTELLAYHYATTYGTDPPDRPTERYLSKQISSWSSN